jgi:putative inorganic carbon (HCO3(-)) transporter
MLRTIFVLALLVPGVCLALWSRYWGLLLYFWNAFFRPQDFMWMRTTNLRLSLILGIIFVVPSILSGYLPNLTHPLSIGILLFLLSGGLAQINAINQSTGLRWLDAQARLTVVILLAVNLVRTPRQLMGLIAVCAGSFGFYATKAGIASFMGGGVQFSDGLDGPFSDNNAYALAICMTIPMMVVVAQNAELTFGGFLPASTIRWIRMGLYVAVPLCIYTVVSTFSRGGFLGLVAVALAYMMFHPRRMRLSLALAMIVGLAFVVPLPEGYLDRLATIKDLQEDVDAPKEDVTEGRFHFWGLAIRMAQEQPLGVGMRNFSSQYGGYDPEREFGRRRDVHSSHFQVLAEQGYLGAAAWIFQFAYGFVIGWKVRKRSRTPSLSKEARTFLETTPTALMVSMAGFFVGGSTISAALNELTWLTFAMLASLDYMSRRMVKEVAAPSPVIRPVAVAKPTPVPAVARAKTGHTGSVAVGMREYRRSR